MKRYIFTLTAYILCLSASAYDFSVDDIFYNILASGNAVEVTHDYNSENSTTGSYKSKVTVPETVTYEGTTYNVTTIGENAFAESARLTEVVLPESITTIERKAFYDCSRLKELTIPQSVTTIGELAFYHCVKLKSLNIPASVDCIGSKAFILCKGLTSLTVDNANTAYSSDNNIIYNKEQTRLVAAMSSYSGHLDLPATVTEIGENAFVECDGLTSINLGNVVTIHDYAFFDCKGLQSITLPESIETLGIGAFFNCTNLTTLKMNNKLREMGERAFMRCISLSDIEFAGNNLVIGNHAFESCKNLSIGDISNCVSEIGDYAFASCIKHRTLTLPASIRRIGKKAFFACSQISRLTLGRELQEIGENAFLNCNRIRQITVNAMTPPAISKNTFASAVHNNATLAVPDESIDNYKAADHWKEFMKIEPSAAHNINNNNNIEVVASNGTINVIGTAPDTQVWVYTTDGTLVQQTTASNLAQYTFERGVYIVKVEKSAYKVAL